MKTRIPTLLLTLMSVLTGGAHLRAQGHAFTYQGRFTENGVPYTGSAEFQPTLWDAASGGSQLAANSPVQVVVRMTNGLFVLPLNFGANFPGADRWLQLDVRTQDAGPFTTLAPRQQLTATAYAITAGNVTGPIDGGLITAGTLTGTQLANNSITAGQLGSGAAAANLNASGQSGVASGGIVLSSNARSAELVNAGYIKLGRTELGEHWQARGLAAAPGARSSHVAVWTGSEMIVWGGYEANSELNTGGSYNPARDSWTALSLAGAPASQGGHTAVWTGSEMIIWGGFRSGGVAVNTGGRYSPAGDSWVPVSLTGAPAARASHSAVWTGGDMIVWGGGNSGRSLIDTFSYTPSRVMYLYQRP